MRPIKGLLGLALALMVSAGSAYAASDSTGVWTKCANEGSTCTFTGTQAVRFGANSLYSTGTFKGTVACTTAVFGDPAKGVTKTCEVLVPASTPVGYSWTNCAKEYGTCTFTGIKTVRFGANGAYNSGSFSGTTSCSNSVFGDPAKGVTKSCDILQANETWTLCASEFNNCTLPGTRTVKFGANSSFVTKVFTNTVYCNGGSFGSDPAPGVTKACYYSSIIPASTTTTPATSTTTTTPTTSAGTSTSTTTPTTTSTSTSTTTSTTTTAVPWTLCARLNDHCNFTGTQVVKTSDPNDATRTAYRVYTNGAYCDNYICEIGGTVPYLPTAATPYVDATKIPVGMQGSDVELSSVATQTANPTEYGPANTDMNITGGAFRLGCAYTHMNFDDPIRYPGQKGASKLMTYFGNTLTDYTSTASSIANTGKTSCQGGAPINRTAYWGSSMIDTRSGTPIAPSGVMTYYKSGNFATSVVPPPSGLRMVAEDLVLSVPNIGKHIHWHCAVPGKDILANGEQDTIPPNCLAGDMYENIVFPVCWDGVNLDSPDHKSHMAYPFYGGSQGGSVNGCPVTHPVLLPTITENIHFTVPFDGATQYWRLSTDAYPTTTGGGLSSTGNWFMGWNQAVMKQLAKTCWQGMRDCHSNFIPALGNLIDPSLPSNGRDLLNTP